MAPPVKTKQKLFDTKVGLASVPLDDIVQQVGDAMWEPEYRLIQAV
jgi:hypothetical protein